MLVQCRDKASGNLLLDAVLVWRQNLCLRVETHPAHAFSLKIDAEKKIQAMVAIL